MRIFVCGVFFQNAELMGPSAARLSRAGAEAVALRVDAVIEDGHEGFPSGANRRIRRLGGGKEETANNESEESLHGETTEEVSRILSRALFYASPAHLTTFPVSVQMYIGTFLGKDSQSDNRPLLFGFGRIFGRSANT
jgi:hypothetical protein